MGDVVVPVAAVPTLPSSRCPADRFWPYVAAFGALWGAAEVTLGSFLHTLRMPFTGVLLASAGACLLVAQRQVLPRRGAALATGVVAALCKSMSPGGAILGPMLGILAEALLVELALMPAPRSVVAAVLAGALAATWAAFQKLVMQILFYGGSVIDLYMSLLRQTAAVLGVPGDAGWSALGGLLGGIAAVGAAAGVLGWRVGREGMRRLALPLQEGQ